MLAGGYYTVEAWLATANREFAGATRFYYQPCDAEVVPAETGSVHIIRD